MVLMAVVLAIEECLIIRLFMDKHFDGKKWQQRD
jgi:hypothetical protein